MKKLSAMRYIVNHKRRVLVIAVTVAISFYLMSAVMYIVTKNEIIIQDFFTDMSVVQQAKVNPGAFEKKNYSNHLEIRKHQQSNLHNYENLVQRIKNDPEVEDAFFSSYFCIDVHYEFADLDYYVPLVSSNEVNKLAERFGTGISEGKMPDTPGEIAASRKLLSNINKEIGDVFNENKKQYKIVGVADIDGYTAFGCKYDDVVNYQILIFSDIKDVRLLLKKNGIEDTAYINVIADYETRSRYLKETIEKFNTISNIMYIIVTIISAGVLLIVYLQYLYDRYSEWCLYYSLGFSLNDIYMTANRELLFTFVTGILLGLLLFCQEFFSELKSVTEYINIKNLMQILSVFVLVFGLFQIAVRYRLKIIKAIDITEEELY